MKITDQVSSENGAPVESAAALLIQLRTPSSLKQRIPWRAIMCALIYGSIAMRQGTDFVLLYLGTLVVVLLIQDHSERQNKKQIDLMIEIIEKIETKKPERQNA